jgi:hypothetical protein
VNLWLYFFCLPERSEGPKGTDPDSIGSESVASFFKLISESVAIFLILKSGNIVDSRMAAPIESGEPKPGNPDSIGGGCFFLVLFVHSWLTFFYPDSIGGKSVVFFYPDSIGGESVAFILFKYKSVNLWLLFCHPEGEAPRDRFVFPRDEAPRDQFV